MRSKSLDKLKKDMLSQLLAEGDKIKKMYEVGEAILGKANNAMLAKIAKDMDKMTNSHITKRFIEKNVRDLKKEYASICDLYKKLTNNA